MSSLVDLDYYTNISADRIAIILTDFKDREYGSNQIIQDKENIKKMLKNLGFQDKNIIDHHNLTKNEIINKITTICTPGNRSQYNGYIIMFNLTYHKNMLDFRARNTWYDPNYIKNCFVANNLLPWATKPKLIFYRIAKDLTTINCSTQSDNVSEKIKYPIEADIFQSFSNDGHEDSDGDDNGSYYIQSLCETINKHIEEKTINDVDLMHIMYEVHEKIEQKIGSSGRQTPHFKSTFVKKFKFPI